jgi:hypothetical protein
MSTESDCAVVMLDEAGVTVTVGVTAVTLTVTVTVFVPVADAYVDELLESGVYVAVSVSVPVASDPAGMVMVAVPALSVTADDVYPPPESVTEPVGVGMLHTSG